MFGRQYEAEEVETWKDDAEASISQVYVHVCFQACFYIPQWC